MDFKDVITKRHAVRRFTDRQIESSIIEDIVDDARRSPSWVDAQETRVFVAMGHVAKAIRQGYIEHAEKHMIGVSDFTVVHRSEWSAAAQRNMQAFSEDIEAHLGNEFEEFVHAQDTLFNAPAFLFLTIPKTAAKWAIMDLGAFEQSILLSATDHGLGSVVAYSFVKYPDIIRKYMPIPNAYDIAIGIGLGYEDKTARINTFQSRRMPVDSILTITK